jgi:hypothetical protein
MASLKQFLKNLNRAANPRQGNLQIRSPLFEIDEHFMPGSIFGAQILDPSFELFSHDDFSFGSFLRCRWVGLAAAMLSRRFFNCSTSVLI